MALISLHNVSIAFGGPNILENISLQIERGQRVCLLGRNGAGKTTLMRILHGELLPDHGEVRRRQGLKLSLLEQQIPEIRDKTVFGVIADQFGACGGYLAACRTAQTDTPDATSRLHPVDATHSASIARQIEKAISLVSLEPDAVFDTLSGGQKRRALLAKALAIEPDLLLLDEPTNHLDIDTIIWIEELIVRMGITLLFVTHDRTFLRKIASRILELDRGFMVDWSCDYDTFLGRKQAVLDAEEKEWNRFDKRLAQEEIWVRTGVKARRTRNEGRVRALLRMRAERAQRRERTGAVAMTLQDAERSGRRVIKAENISFSWNNTPIIHHFSTTILRGDKIGIIGPNGSGKTTLLNILCGKLPCHRGVLHFGTNLEIIYFDQLRELLDDTQSVLKNVLPNGDVVTVNGKDKHVIGYLQEFLFTSDRAQTPVGSLSGGEKNRLALAKLFTKKSNLLIFDEPTNDLDAETLELLEELLNEYRGTVLLVSHDRTFLNNIVTSTMVMEGGGVVKEYVGGYDDWLEQKKTDTSQKKTAKKTPLQQDSNKKQPQKLSFKEKRELEALPEKIDQIEQEIARLHAAMADPDFFSKKGAIRDARNRLADLEKELAASYERWEILEKVSKT